jgi:hypothetical protein
MTSPSSSTPSKFRPYFTASELEEVIRCVKAGSTNMTLLIYLESFNLKIKHSVIAPAHIPAPSIEYRLGLESSSPSDTLSATINQSLINTLHSKFITVPDSLTPSELAIVHKYRYENDLMSPTEEAGYEQSILSPS